jgi:protein-disulfide isomerase
MKKKTLFLTALALLLLGFVAATLTYDAVMENEAGERAMAHYASLERKHSPGLGRTDATVVIVEFLDPACETCAAFYPKVKQIMAANPDRIRLVLRYAPFHKGSDQVVAVLEAARKQNKFWPALEALLATQADWAPHHAAEVERIWPHLERVGLNLEQLRTDMAAPAIVHLIAQDLADAQTLKVTKTPDFFVNGKPLTHFGYEPLKEAIDVALASGRR